MERISENDVRIDQTLYKQAGKVEVYKVFHNRTGQTICMKKIFVEDIQEGTFIQGEFIAMATLQHPNILALKSASLGGHGNSITHVTIFMDYFEEGDLERLIQTKMKSGVYFTETELFAYLNQLIDAFSFMQEKGVAHRDIKPQNIFVCERGKTLKVADLGSAVKTDHGKGANLTGTPLYLSPKLREAFTNNPGGTSVNHDAFKSDVFSLGLTFLYMASLRTIQDLNTLNGLQERITARIDGLPGGMSKFQKVLTKMLTVNENVRPDFLKLAQIVKGIEDDVFRVENWKKNAHIRLNELKGVCDYCKYQYDEKNIYVIGLYMICSNCFGQLFKHSGI